MPSSILPSFSIFRTSGAISSLANLATIVYERKLSHIYKFHKLYVIFNEIKLLSRLIHHFNRKSKLEICIKIENLLLPASFIINSSSENCVKGPGQ